MTGSKVTRTAGVINMLMTAEITEPRASMLHRLLMMPMDEISPTLRVEQRRTRELVIIDVSDVLAAIKIASFRSCPFRISS